YHEPATVVGIRHAASRVLDARPGAHRAEQRIVEFLRAGHVVGPDHDVAEHSGLSSSCRLPAPLAVPPTFAAGVRHYDEDRWRGKSPPPRRGSLVWSRAGQ